MDDPDFYKAVEKGDLKKLDELKAKRLPQFSSATLDNAAELTMSQKVNIYLKEGSILNLI